MNRDNVEKVDAYIERNNGKMKIHVNSLTIELVAEDENPGPLGHENGQEPGIIFWESNYIKKHQEFFEHGTQKPLTHKELDKNSVKNILQTVNNKQGEIH